MKKQEQVLPIKYPNHLASPEEAMQDTRINKSTVKQPIQRLHDPYEIYEHDMVIHKTFMKSVSGYPVPHLLLHNTQGIYFAIPLFGLISLNLGDRQCLLCSQAIPLDSYFPYCTTCYDTSRFYGQMCRFQGPGAPFGVSCTRTLPPCITEGGPTGCFNPHYIYVASIGSYLKVGSSSERRIHGRYARLLEQGIRRAVIVRSFSSLHDAMNAETLIAGLLGLPQKLTAHDKAMGIQQADEPINQESHWIHQKLIEIFPDKSVAGLQIYETPSYVTKAQITLQTIPPPTLEGEIVYSIGKFILINLDPNPYPCEEGDTLVMFDTTRLQGYTIAPPEII